MALYLPVLYGTVRAQRRSFGVARFAAERLALRPGVETRVFDPRDLPFGNLDAREWEMDPRPPGVDAFVREMARADGFLVVTPEYNYGLPGTLKNLLDAVYDEWNRKPFALVGAGGLSGGLRAIDQLRQVVSGVGAVSVPAHVPVFHVAKAFGPDGPVADAPEWERRFDKLADELLWYATALKAAREAPAPG